MSIVHADSCFWRIVYMYIYMYSKIFTRHVHVVRRHEWRRHTWRANTHRRGGHETRGYCARREAHLGRGRKRRRRDHRRRYSGVHGRYGVRWILVETTGRFEKRAHPFKRNGHVAATVPISTHHWEWRRITVPDGMLTRTVTGRRWVFMHLKRGTRAGQTANTIARRTAVEPTVCRYKTRNAKRRNET